MRISCIYQEIYCIVSVRKWLPGLWGWACPNPREGNGTPLQYSCLENPTDGEAWWVAVHGVATSRTRLSNFTFMHWRRKWQPTPVFLRGESQGRESLVGCCLWGHNGQDWGNLAAAAACPKSIGQAVGKGQGWKHMDRISLGNLTLCSWAGVGIGGVEVGKSTIPFSRRSSWARDRTQISCTVGGTLYCLSYQGSLLTLCS